MDAQATAKYLDKRIDEAVEYAQDWRAQLAESLTTVMVAGSHVTSGHVLDRLVEHEAKAVAWLEIRDIAGGKLSQVGHEAFLEAVRKVRGEIKAYLRNSWQNQTGSYAMQSLAAHNAATLVLSGTDVIELIDYPEPEKAREALAWLRTGWNGDNSARAITAFWTLDKAGIFRDLEGQSDKETSAQWSDVTAGERHATETAPK